MVWVRVTSAVTEPLSLTSSGKPNLDRISARPATDSVKSYKIRLQDQRDQVSYKRIFSRHQNVSGRPGHETCITSPKRSRLEIPVITSWAQPLANRFCNMVKIAISCYLRENHARTKGLGSWVCHLLKFLGRGEDSLII